VIDLRSDTVTRPTRAMREAMLDAEVGDDVYAEDPTVNRLEERVAAMLGKERALFVPTGVMSNQLCLKAHTRPGDEVIVGTNSHIFNYETGAPALLSGIQLHTIPDAPGWPEIGEIDEAVREAAYYLPRTAVIALEQTHNRAGGTVIPIDAMRSIAAFGRERGIAMHLDGARLFNACVASSIAPRDYAEPFDTVSICLSKGLGAPIGSVLAGPAALVEIAHKFRKVWGGGWRQAGMLAAAGLHALEYHVERLRDDHRKATAFADALDGHASVSVPVRPQTNIVLLLVDGVDAAQVAARLAERGVLVSAAFKGKLRAVFHMDVSLEDAQMAAAIIREELDSLEPSSMDHDAVRRA
jgi:threonine aldolase